MAQVALTFAGGMVPGIGPIAAMFGNTLGRYIDDHWLFPNRKKRNGPSPEALQVQTSTYGTGIPVVYGIMRIAGNVIWCAKIRSETDQDDVEHKYASFAVGICVGPVAEVLEIYVNGQRLISYRSDSGIRRHWTDDAQELDAQLTYRIYKGTETQDKDVLICQTEGETKTPAFRGLAYIVFEDFPLDLTNGSIPNLTFEIAQSITAVCEYEEIDIGTYLSQIWSYTPSAAVYASPEITDIDNDGANEIVFSSYNNTLYVLRSDGSVKNSRTNAAGYNYASVCCVDIDGDGDKWIIAGDTAGCLYCYPHNLGAPRWLVHDYYTRNGYQPDFGNDKYWFHAVTSGLATIGGTPTLCIFAAGYDGVLACFRATDGALLWELNTNVGNYPWNTAAKNNGFYNAPIVSDIDLDGQPEILTVDVLGDLRRTEHTGGTPQSPPPDTSTFKFTGSGAASSDAESAGVAVADIDDDDAVEIVFTGTHNDGVQGYMACAWVVDLAGNQKSFIAVRPGHFYGQPVIHDTFGTGNKVIYLVDSQGYVTCLEYTGSPRALAVRWEAKVSANAINGAAALLDIDGDGEKEVLVCADYYLIALSARTGAEKQRIWVGASVDRAVTGGDIDGDTYVEIIVPCRLPAKVLCFRGGPTSPGNWFRRQGFDAGRTGEVTASDPDGGAFRDRDLAAQDNLVRNGSTYKDRIFIESSGVWSVWDMRGGNEILMTFDSRINGVQQIPAAAGCDFDIDEDDDIYTTVYYSPSSAALVKLNGNTMARIADTLGTTLFYTPTKVRVSKNSARPWVAAICGDFEGNYIYVWDRRTLRFGSLSVKEIDPVSSAYRITSCCFDADGTLWWVEKKADGYGRLRRADIGTDYVVNISTWICSLPEYGSAQFLDLVMTDDATNQIIIGSTSMQRMWFYTCHVIAWPAFGLTYVGVMTGQVIGTYPKSAWQNGANVVGGNGRFFYTYGTDTIHGIDLTTRTIVETYTVNPSPGGWAGGCVPALANSMVCGVNGSGFSYAWVKYGRAEPLAAVLSDVIWDICERCGLTYNADFSTALLTSSLWGYVLDNRMSGADAIAPLSELFFFDAVEEGGVIKFIPRGGASAMTIPKDHLTAHRTEDGRPQEMEIIRERPGALASTVEVIFIDYDANYEQGTQRAARGIGYSEEILAVRAPVAIEGTDARRIAYRTLGVIWTGQNQRKFSLPRDYFRLSPADVVTVETEDADVLVRVDTVDLSGGVVEIQTSDENPEIYDVEYTAAKPDVPVVSLLSPGVTYMRLIDCALLNGLDDSPGVYVAATGKSSSWNGAALYVSRDRGESWSSWGYVSGGTAVGKTTNALADHADVGVMDRSSLLYVRIIGTGTLSSASDDELLGGANLAVVGNEALQFQMAELMSDGTYLLRNLVRGRRGTEQATGGHTVAEDFALMSGMKFHRMSLEDRNIELYYKAVSVGAAGDSDIGRAFTAMFVNLKPLAPCEVAGVRDGSNNLTVSWTRRTRIAGEWQDLFDVPLGETTEAYEVDVLIGTTVVRTISVGSASCSYTAAQQSADGITPGAPVRVQIHQMSSSVGRGFAAMATV